MGNPPQESVSVIALLGVFLLLAACVTTWVWVAYRLSQGIPLLPYERRRSVPWKFLDLAAVFVGYVAMAFWLSFVVQLVLNLGGHAAPAPAERADQTATEQADQQPADQPETSDENPDVAHPIIVLLRNSPNLPTLVFCLVVAAVLAPLAEEIMFRLLLQGWLEGLEARRCRRLRMWRRVPRGLVPILIVSALFALGHFRTEHPSPATENLIYLFLINALAEVLAIGVGLGLIWHFRGATLTDFGLVPARFWGDVGRGIVAFVAFAPVVLLIQALATKYLLPRWLAADPIALFVFAAVLGTLYCRTHRIVPAIVTHMALNAASLAGAWLLVAK